MLLTVTNLYPRPDQPQRGLFNAQIFNELANFTDIENICLVPSWQIHKWGQIRKWASPYPAPFTTHYLPVFYIPAIGRNIGWRWYLKALQSFPLDFSNINCILSPWLYPDGTAATIWANKHNTPCWIRVMGSDTFHLQNQYRREMIAKTAKFNAGFYCVSQNIVDSLLSIKVPKEKIHLIRNGINKEKFFPYNKEAAKKELGRDTGKKLYLFIGNLVEVKGPDILLEAWRQFAMQYPSEQTKSDLVVIGTGVMEKGLRAYARHHNLHESVQFIGQVPHAQIPKWINAADCLCLSSRNEGMPNVVVEATACGARIIASDVGACRMLLQDYPLGMVVTPNSPLQIAEALHSILQNDTPQQLMNDYITAIPSWRDQAEKIINMIKG